MIINLNERTNVSGSDKIYFEFLNKDRIFYCIFTYIKLYWWFERLHFSRLCCRTFGVILKFNIRTTITASYSVQNYDFTFVTDLPIDRNNSAIYARISLRTHHLIAFTAPVSLSHTIASYFGNVINFYRQIIIKCSWNVLRAQTRAKCKVISRLRN